MKLRQILCLTLGLIFWSSPSGATSEIEQVRTNPAYAVTLRTQLNEIRNGKSEFGPDCALDYLEKKAQKYGILNEIQHRFISKMIGSPKKSDEEIFLEFGYDLNPVNTPIAKINDKLFLSSVIQAENFDLLKALGITHILNLTGYKHGTSELRYPPKFRNDFEYAHLVIADEDDPVTMLTFRSNFFEAGNDFIHQALMSRHSSRVLVHCEAGISRSSTLVISHLMSVWNLSVKEAFETVKNLKANIAPNQAFFRQLLELESWIVNTRGLDMILPSYPIHDYLVDQMLEGPAAGFLREAVETAIVRAKYDPNQAMAYLFEAY